MTWLESKIRVNPSQNDSFFDSSKKIESISLDFILLESKTRVNLTRLWLTLTRNVSSQSSHNWLEFNSSLLRFDSGLKIFDSTRPWPTRVDSTRDSTYHWYIETRNNIRYGRIFRASDRNCCHIYIYINIHFACPSVCVSLTIRLRVIIVTWVILMKVKDLKKNSVLPSVRPCTRAM